MLGRRTILTGLLGILMVAAFALPAAAENYFVYPNSGRLTQVYWTKVSYTSSGYHKGLDIAEPSGNPVLAARQGTVTFRGWSSVGYGNLVIVSHESSYQTYYGHNSSFTCSLNQGVAAGQQISVVGSTGNSTGPHVHWEIRRYGSPIYIPGAVYNTVTRGTPLNYFYADLTPLGGAPPPPPPSTNKAMKVTASTLNVRSGPGTSYGIVGYAYANQIYISFEQNSGWHRIWYNGNTGWCSGSYLSQVTGVTARKVTLDNLNVRTGPGTGYSIVGTAKINSLFYPHSSSSGWYGIYYGGSSQRWFSGAYTTGVGM
jgi:uncharacterized protein YraI